LRSFFGSLEISKILVPSINIYFWIIYYIVLIGGVYLYRHKEFFERFKNIIKYFVILAIVIGIIILIPKERKFVIHFLDVGQGDSCLIVTPENNTILVDGGNNEFFDCGKNIVGPYLLKNGIIKVDYVIVSHGDADHIGGLFYVLESIDVENVIISYQVNNSRGANSEQSNIEKMLEIINQKHINLVAVNKGDCLKIEEDVTIDILWPDKDNLIKENALNNNSIVCKINYKENSILFTGDIEEIAEKKILQEYRR